MNRFPHTISIRLSREQRAILADLVREYSKGKGCFSERFREMLEAWNRDLQVPGLALKE
jgi:hypothetical protein